MSDDPALKLLEEALSIVGGARRAAYGTPEDNFKRIASRWNTHLKQRMEICSLRGVPFEFTEVDVAMMMVDVKMARLVETPEHRDSWVDIAGYAACGVRCALRDKK